MQKLSSTFLIVVFLAGLIIAQAQDKAKVEWMTSIEQAIEKAQKENKNIFVDFTGSDWCGWCIKLREEVLDTPKWQEEGNKRFVFVELDFPSGKEISASQKEYNAKMLKKYGIQGYPTILLLDSNGNVYGKTGYQEGGPEKYILHVDELAGRKKEIEALMKQKAEGTEENKIKVLDELDAKLTKWGLDVYYLEVKSQLMDLDKENKKGYLTKFSGMLARYYFEKDKKQSDVFLEIAKKYAPEDANNIEIELKLLPPIVNTYLNKKKWQEGLKELAKLMELKPTGETEQKVYFLAGVSEARMDNKQKAVEYLEKAIKAAPESELAEWISERILPDLKEN